MYTTTIALALALAPSTPTTDYAPPFEVADIEVERGPESTTLTAFDGDGEVAAEIVQWTDGDGHTRLDTHFADGVYVWVAIDGDSVEVESNNPAEAADRLASMGATTQASWEDVSADDLGWCAGALIGAAGAAVTGNLLGTIGASIIAGVNCGNVLEGLAE
jgi:hypothetical protein